MLINIVIVIVRIIVINIIIVVMSMTIITIITIVIIIIIICVFFCIWDFHANPVPCSVGPEGCNSSVFFLKCKFVFL